MQHEWLYSLPPDVAESFQSSSEMQLAFYETHSRYNIDSFNLPLKCNHELYKMCENYQYDFQSSSEMQPAGTNYELQVYLKNFQSSSEMQQETDLPEFIKDNELSIFLWNATWRVLVKGILGSSSFNLPLKCNENYDTEDILFTYIIFQSSSEMQQNKCGILPAILLLRLSIFLWNATSRRDWSLLFRLFHLSIFLWNAT